ncbi:hypothetical protein MKEN_00049600 [Mycena kentingensis (nom. inval.)]|nr:hypothetical protein MKEN_00049600 [Mycena kentingensis (nom. inval.)]
MPKATLLQRALGRPTKRYSQPPSRNLYSDKARLVALALIDDAAAASPPPRPTTVRHTNNLSQNDDDDTETVFYTPRSSLAVDDDDANEMSATITTTRSSVYTDQDYLQFLVNKPKRTPIPVPTRVSRSPTPSIMMSMAALLEEDEDPPKIGLPPPSTVIISPSRSSTPTHRRTRSTASSVYTPRSAPPSGPPDLPSYGTPAYVSLTVPPAPLPSYPLTRSTSLSKRIKTSFRRDGADLSRSRLAQATMASIEVVTGLASSSRTQQPPRLGFSHYRTPPSVSKSSVLVQVWAVGLDAVDIRLLGNSVAAKAELPRQRTQSIGRFIGRSISLSRRSISDSGSVFEKDAKDSAQPAAQVGFMPGRSFVGRVIECGFEVREDVARRGEWVVGLLDIRKSGALAEYIVVDRHRLHRVPQPHTPGSHSQSTPPNSRPQSRSSHDGYTYSHSNQDSPYPSRPSSVAFALSDSPPSSRPSSRQNYHGHRKSRSAPAPVAPPPPPGPTLEELALLPLGLAAYRAIRTLVGLEGAVAQAQPGTISPDGELEVDPMTATAPLAKRKEKPRALVLNGHAGVGSYVARLLVARGWRVCVHAPGTLDDPAFDVDDEERDREHMAAIQARVQAWGAEEVVFDDGGAVGDEEDGGWGRAAAVRALERVIDDGDVFDAVVDTIGGRAVWEAGERLLRRADGVVRRKMFTTTVGDAPGRPIPTAKDNFRGGLRAMKAEKEKKSSKGCVVGYAWVNAATDVDWEGGDVRDGLAALVRVALDQESVRAAVEDPGAPLPFERAVDVFETVSLGTLVRRGGSVVVKVAG